MKYRFLLGCVLALMFSFGLAFESIAASDPALTSSLTAQTAPTLTSSPVQGAQLFETHCIGCHVGGGNILKWGKNLKLKALHNNKVDTVETIAALVSAGKGNMSAYATKLTPVEIEAVSQYVLDQAAKDWK